MKKCPTCDKEFPDSMRFCQTDGTVLIDDAPPEDQYKTTLGRQEDIAPLDLFATMVNTSFKKEDADDLLQLPDEKFQTPSADSDPLKTMVASENEIRREMDKMKAEESSPVEMPPKDAAKSGTGDSPFAPPAPPVFNEPQITPPNFNDAPISGQKTAVVQNPFSEPPKKEEVKSSPFDSKPASPFDPKPNDAFNSSPYSNSGNTGPIPSPFDISMPPGYQQPSSPLPQYKEPEPLKPLPTYQEPPAASSHNPFNDQIDNQPSAGQGAVMNPNDYNNQNQAWNPPPAPDSNWQNQPIGQDTPFQSPVAGQQSQTLAIASLICGIISLLAIVGSIIPLVGIICGLASFALAIAAIVTGFLARSRAAQNPAQYGGSGLALGGIITGGLTLAGMIIMIILGLALGVLFSMQR